MYKGAGLETSSFYKIYYLSILFIFLNASKKAFYFIAIPITLAYALYTPVGATFGGPSYKYLMSFFATDSMETKEFLQQIPYLNWLYALAIPILIICFRWVTIQYHIEFHRNKAFLCISIVILLIPLQPFEFFNKSYESFKDVYAELKKLNSLSRTSQWGASQLNLIKADYDDYVLIIGESARKDYHHTYGYPIENTPFMDKTHGVIVDGFTSAGTNTVSSLRLMLTQPDTEQWQPNYTLTLVDLVKSAGIETYWISNQGYLGTYDTPISAIAKKSNKTIFLKTAEYNSRNTSDYLLVEKFTHELQKPSSKKRFFIVHLYGSHPNACDRIVDIAPITTVKDNYYNYISCYVSSIYKTDSILEKLYLSLDNNLKMFNRSYSMIYFSDHGLAHREINGQIVINNNRASAHHYDIPLIKISSDDTERKEYKAFKSGLMFTNGLANWMGIENSKLNKGYDLFSPNSDKNDFGLNKKIQTISTPNDPAIDISDK